MNWIFFESYSEAEKGERGGGIIGLSIYSNEQDNIPDPQTILEGNLISSFAFWILPGLDSSCREQIYPREED